MYIAVESKVSHVLKQQQQYVTTTGTDTCYKGHSLNRLLCFRALQRYYAFKMECRRYYECHGSHPTSTAVVTFSLFKLCRISVETLSVDTRENDGHQFSLG